MAVCICRRKEKRNASSAAHLLANQRIFLFGSDFQTSFVSLLNSLLPSGVTLTGTVRAFGNGDIDTGYTLSANTSNNPEPALLPRFPGVTYNTPEGIWGAAACLFKQDNMENLATHFTDVNQGAIANCWAMAAISALARYGNLPSGMSVIQQCFVSISPADSQNPSKVTVNLYSPDSFGRTTEPFAQEIDTKIPVRSTNTKEVAFVRSDSEGEYWPCMMEKALAAALTTTRSGVTVVGYPAMEFGYTAVGMSFFAPGVPAYIQTTTNDAQDLFSTWDKLMASGITVTVYWLPATSGVYAANGEPYGAYGLVSRHTYTVYSVINVDGFQLALFRNPWGKGTCSYMQSSLDGEWTGAWSDCSPDWDAHPNVKAACGFTGPRSDGLFWMSFDDIAKYLQAYGIFIPSSPDLRAKDLRPSPFVRVLVKVTFTTRTASMAFAGDIGWGVVGTDINFPFGSFTQPATTYTFDADLSPGSYKVNGMDFYMDGWNGTTLEVSLGTKVIGGPWTLSFGFTETWSFTVPSP